MYLGRNRFPHVSGPHSTLDDPVHAPVEQNKSPCPDVSEVGLPVDADDGVSSP
jgi:hypothetical protein